MNNQSPPGLPRQNGDGPTSPSPRSVSGSLQAAATLNAGLRAETETSPFQSPQSARRDSTSQSPSSNRRISQVLHNLAVAEPGLPRSCEIVTRDQPPSAFPAPGRVSPRFTGSPLMLPSGGPPDSPRSHNRTLSLGELHQELENEQEFQVNRLLQQIRQLQDQVDKQQQGESAIANDEAVARSPSVVATRGSRSPSVAATLGSRPEVPFPRSRSRGASPGFRSLSGDTGDQGVFGLRDEAAYYQAETQNLTRENQMLRHRIKELERQLAEAEGRGSSSSTHEPAQSSHLNRSTSISEEETQAPSTQPAHVPLPTVADTPKEE